MKVKFLLVFILIFSVPSFAQESESQKIGEFPKRYSEFGLAAGEFLPFGIFGVRSDYAAWWMRYGHNLGGWRVDWVFHHVNAEGVTWYRASIGLGGVMDLYDMARVAFYIGPCFNYYKGLPTNIRELPWTFSTGMHVGASPMAQISGPVFMRGDFQMNFGPGQSLYAGLGLAYLF